MNVMKEALRTAVKNSTGKTPLAKRLAWTASTNSERDQIRQTQKEREISEAWMEREAQIKAERERILEPAWRAREYQQRQDLLDIPICLGW